MKSGKLRYGSDIEPNEACFICTDEEIGRLRGNFCKYTLKDLEISKQKKDIKVIFNNPATILFVNGKKYISKAHDETFDEEKGLLMCLAKANGISHLELQRMIKNAKRQSLPPKERKSINGVSIDPYKFINEIRECFGLRPFSDEYKPTFSKPKKKRGRPRKYTSLEVRPKRPVGRPRKNKEWVCG